MISAIILIIIYRISFALLAIIDASEEAYATHIKHFYERYLDTRYKLFVIQEIEDIRKKEKHYYWSLDRAVIYILLLAAFYIQFKNFEYWYIVFLIEAISLGMLFTALHDSWIKKRIHDLNIKVYPKGFFANSDGKSKAFFDRFIPDTWERRAWFFFISILLTLIQITIILTI